MRKFQDSTGTTMNYKACQQISTTCVNQITNNSCFTGSLTCENYGSYESKCTYDLLGKKCFWDTNQRTCTTQTSNICEQIVGSNITLSDCQAFNNWCIANRIGTACYAILGFCTSYSNIQHCVQSSNGDCIQTTQKDSTAQCTDITASTPCEQLFLAQGTIYSQTLCTKLKSTCTFVSGSFTCISKTCSNALLQTSFENCQDWLKSCTFDEIGACVLISATCAAQPIQLCYQASEGLCVVQNDACVKRTNCDQALYSLNTHKDCVTFLSTCTVARLGGCQSRAECSSYISQIQCVTNIKGQKCYWNKESYRCVDLSCENLEQTSTYDTHEKCYAVNASPQCTIRVSNGLSANGCQALSDCSSYTIQAQCWFNQYGAPCVWQNNSCLNKTCDNAPNTIISDSECNAYLDGCGLTTENCRNKICEDYIFPTDSLCSIAEPTCTSNGTNCVFRGTCSQALTAAGCLTQSDGKKCQWLEATTTKAAYCAIKSCGTAPNYTTESECSSYYPGCTVRNGGGCIVKSTCAAAAQAACTKDVDGNDCVWDEQKFCRNKNKCSEFQSSTLEFCQSIDSKCVLGNAQCADIQQCSDYKIPESCIFGIDGPCLWISETCYLYTSCNSIAWLTHEECNQLSDNCTTNGEHCVPITSCDETHTSGGCVYGNDGPCMQVIETDGSLKCKKLTTCSSFAFKTHKECQNVSIKCTTNGQECQDLMECQYYTKDTCYLNKLGPLIHEGQVLSTGKCVWDQTLRACRDQKCTDLNGKTDQACSAQLSECISLGELCEYKMNCNKYKKYQCPAEGTDGKCVEDNYQCRLNLCSELDSKNLTSCSVLPTCISDGIKYLQKQSCGQYSTIATCNQGGTDGFCAFNSQQKSCRLMNQCSDANEDVIGCKNTKKCYFNSEKLCVPSKCEYLNTNTECNSYYYQQWNETKKFFCEWQNEKCLEVEPQNLNAENCLKKSDMAYTWNAEKKICQICADSFSITQSKSTDCLFSNSCLNQKIAVVFQTSKAYLKLLELFVIAMI